MPRTLHRRMTWLAVLASALLCLMPTASRVLHAWAPVAPAGHGMHVMPNGEVMSAAAMAIRVHPGAPGEHAGHGGGDCEYCPLLAGLLASVGVPVVPMEVVAHATPTATHTTSATTPAPVPSLGSQAPPVLI
jgi:hypothetical protein